MDQIEITLVWLLCLAVFEGVTVLVVLKKLWILSKQGRSCCLPDQAIYIKEAVTSSNKTADVQEKPHLVAAGAKELLQCSMLLVILYLY